MLALLEVEDVLGALLEVENAEDSEELCPPTLLLDTPSRSRPAGMMVASEVLSVIGDEQCSPWPSAEGYADCVDVDVDAPRSVFSSLGSRSRCAICARVVLLLALGLERCPILRDGAKGECA